MFITTSLFTNKAACLFTTSVNISKWLKACIALIVIVLGPNSMRAQVKEDTLIIKSDTTAPVQLNNLSLRDSVTVDTLTKSREHTPRGAVIRSAILPGWGQAYNKKYWKIPIVYGALGATAAVFNYNIKYYRKIRFAYQVVINDRTEDIDKVAPELRPLVDARDVASLRINRNTFRKNIDYSVVVFVLFWGLNVLDATVDGHLKGFNVTDDISMKIKPMLSSNNLGLSLAVDIHKGKKKLLTLAD